MNMRIKRNATCDFVEIDGTRFDMPNDSARREGLRELVVNHYCLSRGFAPLYPEATAIAKD